MEKGYEGPYDVVLEMHCLDTVCAEKKDFMKCVRILDSLLKPGGMFVRFSTNAPSETGNQFLWRAGGKDYTLILLTHEFVTSVLRKCGFREVSASWEPFDPNTTGHGDGHHFITATKE